MLNEKKNTPAIQVFRHRELAQKIAGLTEDIEELKSEKALLLNQFNCADEHGIDEIKQPSGCKLLVVRNLISGRWRRAERMLRVCWARW